MPLMLSVGVLLCLLYAQASGSLDEMRLGGLLMLGLALSSAPRDLAVLARGNFRERWRVRATQAASLDVGLHLFLFVFGIGTGLAFLFDAFGELSGLVYVLFLLLLLLNAILVFVKLAVPKTDSNTAGC